MIFKEKFIFSYGLAVDSFYAKYKYSNMGAIDLSTYAYYVFDQIEFFGGFEKGQAAI